MVEVYKEHLWISDADGNFPLSIACQCPVANRSSYLLTKVQLLLRENPRAATLCNSRGRYPLHVALNSGIAWNEGIAALLQAFPPALNIRDPLTRLYPFALAAMAPDDLPTKNDLTTVFCVLRADPSILKPNFFEPTRTLICHAWHEYQKAPSQQLARASLVGSCIFET